MPPAADAIALTLQAQTSTLRAATWGELFVTEWLAAGSGDDIREAARLHLAFSRALGERKHASVTLIHAAAVRPLSSDANAAVREAFREIDPRIKVGAVVLMTEGFGGALVRSLITGVMAVRSSAYPNKVFSTTTEACAWLAPHVTAPDGQPATREQLLGVFEALSARRGGRAT